MNNIIPLLNPATIADETELTEQQLATLDLSKLPKKVRVRVCRPTALIQIQRIGLKLVLQHIGNYHSGSIEHEEECSAVANEALSRDAAVEALVNQANQLTAGVVKGIKFKQPEYPDDF